MEYPLDKLEYADLLQSVEKYITGIITQNSVNLPPLRTYQLQ